MTEVVPTDRSSKATQRAAAELAIIVRETTARGNAAFASLPTIIQRELGLAKAPRVADLRARYRTFLTERAEQTVEDADARIDRERVIAEIRLERAWDSYLYATRPKALRNKEGELIDFEGAPVAEPVYVYRGGEYAGMEERRLEDAIRYWREVSGHTFKTEEPEEPEEKLIPSIMKAGAAIFEAGRRQSILDSTREVPAEPLG